MQCYSDSLGLFHMHDLLVAADVAADELFSLLRDT